MDDDYSFKIILVGDSETGKSALLHRYCRNSFDNHSVNTIGFDLGIKHLQVRDRKVKMKIWDTSGQERFRSLTTGYYRDAHGVMVVFDLTNPSTKKNIHKWIRDVKEYSSRDVPIVIVGNKSDLVQEEETHSFIQPFITASAKDDINVSQAFEVLVEAILDDIFQSELVTVPLSPCSIEEPERKEKSSCCNLN